MKTQKLTFGLAIASAVLMGVVPARPADAQILELAGGALSLINSITGNSRSQPAPQPAPPPVAPRPMAPPSPSFSVGAGNLNGNKINLCVSGCLPHQGQIAPARPNVIHTFPPAVSQPVPQP